jgi:hypothetical protein
MTDKNVPEESDVDMAKAELHDLIHFWDSLSCWEREQCIITVEDFLDKASECPSDTSVKQLEKMREQIKALAASNQIEKQSKVKSLMLDPSPDFTKERKKPNFNKSMEIIHSLSPEELIKLGDYMGMNKAKLSLIKPEKLHEMYEDILKNRTITIFFATRNYLGRNYL